MDEKDFSDVSPGRLLRTLEGQPSFCPNSLPPALAIDQALQHQLSRADNLLGRLDGMASWLPDPQLLVRSFIRREALLSSNIEDTFAAYEEVARFEIDKNVENANQDVREVYNAEQAITFGLDAVREKGRRISLGLVKEMHSILLNGVRGREIMRGAFRGKEVYIGKKSEGIDAARFVPPPFHLVQELMSDLESFIQADASLHPVVKAGLTHYQFETIHPFEDGNGRLGRVLILLQLCGAKLLNTPALNPSLHFEMHRDEYYDALLAVSTRGEWQGWLTYFARGIATAAEDAIDRLTKIRELRAAYHDLLQSGRNSALLLKLVDNLFVLPVLTVTDAATMLKVTYPSAKLNIQKLIDAGILKEQKRQMPQTYVAPRILALLRVDRS